MRQVEKQAEQFEWAVEVGRLLLNENSYNTDNVHTPHRKLNCCAVWPPLEIQCISSSPILGDGPETSLASGAG